MSTAMAVAVALPGAGFAETLADTLVKAYQTSPTLQAARAALRATDERLPQAESAKKIQSQLSASANAFAVSDDDYVQIPDYYNAALEASLLVYDHGQTAAAIESARMSIAAARADLLDVEQQVLYAAVSSYMDVRQAVEFLQIARNDVQVLEEQRRAINNRFDVGEVTRTDVSLTEAQLQSSRAQLADAEGNLQTARQAYLAAVGTLPGDLEPPPPTPDLTKTVRDAVAIGLRSNPQIISAQFAERGAIADFDRALAAKGPTVSVSGSYGYQGYNRYQGYDRMIGQVGVSGSLPLTTGGNLDSVVRQAQQVVDQRKSQLQAAGRNVTQNVNAAWIQLDVAKATILANQRQLDASRIAYEGVVEEARLGARSTLDVLNSNQDRLQAEAEVVRSHRNEYVAAYAVLQAMGLLTAEHLKLGVQDYDPNVYFNQVRNGPRGGYDTSAVDRVRARWQQ
ncbi:TolC family outer membrane protein [Amaricoccus solimangrovi]|nr:TolC family outer membrane protein [Amaricoccus solimangrovi]